MFAAELLRIAFIEIGRLVQLLVAALGRIGAQPGNALPPRSICTEHDAEMRRVGAIDHVIGRCIARGAVNLFDRVLEALAGGQTPIGFQRK